MSFDLELVAEKDLIDELLHRFDHGIFIAVKPPPCGDGKPEFATICEWGSSELMAFHCRAYATALEQCAGNNIRKSLNTETEE